MKVLKSLYTNYPVISYIITASRIINTDNVCWITLQSLFFLHYKPLNADEDWLAAKLSSEEDGSVEEHEVSLAGKWRIEWVRNSTILFLIKNFQRVAHEYYTYSFKWYPLPICMILIFNDESFNCNQLVFLMTNPALIIEIWKRLCIYWAELCRVNDLLLSP